MTQEERIRAVIDCSFTKRQARFLVLVMRHSGVCIPRQLEEYANVLGEHRKSSPRCRALPQMLSGDRVQFR